MSLLVCITIIQDSFTPEIFFNCANYSVLLYIIDQQTLFPGSSLGCGGVTIETHSGGFMALLATANGVGEGHGYGLIRSLVRSVHYYGTPQTWLIFSHTPIDFLNFLAFDLICRAPLDLKLHRCVPCGTSHAWLTLVTLHWIHVVSWPLIGQRVSAPFRPKV